MVCRKIYIYSGISEDSSDIILPLAGKDFRHCVGAMVWGLERTSDLLFASSEPPLEHELNGHHKAYDITKQKMAYQFDAHEAGDTISIAADGTFFLRCLTISDLHTLSRCKAGSPDTRAKPNTYASTLRYCPWPLQ